MKKKEKPKPVKVKKEKFDYSTHMKGMPEYSQKDLSPVKQLTVSFATNEDMHKFSKLVGQLITAKTRSIWYPEVKNNTIMDKRWVSKQ